MTKLNLFNIRYLLYCTIGILSYVSCVEPINLVISSSESILVVDGAISDTEGDQVISIIRSLPSSRNASYSGETGAEVYILENGQNKIICTEKEKGKYYLPTGFKTLVGNTYQLKFKTKPGLSYESEIETMRFTPPITKIYSVLEPKGIDDGNIKTPGHYIYIDTKDGITKGDNYLWTFKLTEQQSYCISCYGGIFLTSPLPAGRCSSVAAFIADGITSDYSCSGNCWDFIFSNEINVMSDVYSNGNEIKGRLVGKIPIYQSQGALLEVFQQNVSPSAFRYLKLLASQSQNSGTLVDSPPAALVGNIVNENDKFESVGGFFMVGNSKSIKYWLDRKDAKNYEATGLFGRPINAEPPSPDGSRPPFAPCIKSKNRTPTKPVGWPL